MAEAPALTALFVEKILALRCSDLPPAVVDMAKQVALDTFAVILAGADEPEGIGRIVSAYVRELGGKPDASVIARGYKTSILNAAYANGTMAHALDFDAMFYPLNPPASPTLPAIFAIAERDHLSGARVIEAIVTAFEVQARVRLAATGMAVGAGFHKPGIAGPFGATAAAIKLLDLNAEQASMALGLAGSRLGGMTINTGTMTKSSHAGHAARMGVECAVLAKKGWTASADIFGRRGFFDTYVGGSARPELLIEGYGTPFRIVSPGVGLKKHPCNYFLHRPIDAALALREEFQILPAQIENLQIIFPRFELVSRPRPLTGLDAKFSVQYSTLVALLDGEITVLSYTNERCRAPDVRALLPKVELKIDDSIPADLDQMHSIVNIKLKDGRLLTKRVDKLSGWMGTPLTRDERLKKFFVCARERLKGDAAQRLLEQIDSLETLSDVTAIMDIARCEAR